MTMTSNEAAAGTPRVGRHARPDTADDAATRALAPPPGAAPAAPRARRSATAAVEVAGLTKEFDGRRVVDDVDFTVPAGTVCGLLGPNGAGKTTTVRMLATLLRPTSGTVTVLGRDVVADATAVRSLIALTGQYASVDGGPHRPREPRDIRSPARTAGPCRAGSREGTRRPVRPDRRR